MIPRITSSNTLKYPLPSLKEFNEDGICSALIRSKHRGAIKFDFPFFSKINFPTIFFFNPYVYLHLYLDF